jgi:sRNA-binding protein
MHSEQNPAPAADTPAEQAPAPEAPAERAEPPGLSPAECGARLAALFPALFVAPGAPGPFKPIKLRVHADILERAPGVFTKRVLGIFFSRYTTANGYLKALVAEGAQRHDLDGQPTGAIADEHRAAAVEELARRHALAAERRAAQRKPPPPPPPDSAPTGERPARPPREHGARADTRPRRPEWQPAGPSPQRRGDRPPPRRLERPPAAHAAPRETPAAVAPPAPAMPTDPAQRERMLLLRAFESSPLSKANFCALKRISEAELDAQLAAARQEREGKAKA